MHAVLSPTSPSTVGGYKVAIDRSKVVAAWFSDEVNSYGDLRAALWGEKYRTLSEDTSKNKPGSGNQALRDKVKRFCIGTSYATTDDRGNAITPNMPFLCSKSIDGSTWVLKKTFGISRSTVPSQADFLEANPSLAKWADK